MQDTHAELIINDGRQSPVAAAVQRGASRLLRAHGFATVCELPLANGRRVDIMAVSASGALWAIEIKSSIADLRADHKWPEYEEFCDRLYFAIPPELPSEIMPEAAGLIVADRWGAEILRHGEEHLLPAARRKAVTLRLARAAALRLQLFADPNC